MKIGVIGAGAAGITAAYELARDGASVEVFEAGGSVGGMARTIDLWGQKVDLGPHRFFSQDARVNRIWLDVVGRDYAMVDRLTRIYYKNSFFQYPLKPFNALGNLGLIESCRCMGSYLWGKLFCYDTDEPAFEDWVVNRFGQRLFEVFFKTYTEKLWGISCKQLDADFAAQRIKKLSLYEAVKNAFFASRGTRHKTLLDRFAYPLGGTGMVYERMAEKVRAWGGSVHLHRPVKRVLQENYRVVGLLLEDGSMEPFDHVVSTMPLSRLVRGLDDAPPRVMTATDALTYRNTIIVFLRVEAANLFPDQWLYIHSPDLQMGRVTNFRNWVPELYGTEPDTILALEYWAYDHDAIWSAADKELIDLAAREIRSTGLLRDSEVNEGFVSRIPYSYPVYQRGYKKHIEVIVNHLNGFSGLTPIGRYGAFKYNNQDHSILMGLLAAENILHEAKHDLWAVNADYDSYQEAAVITDTGLEPALNPG